MRRTARVLETGYVNIPNSNEPALRVTTDYPVAENRAFFIKWKEGDPVPADATEITWGDHDAGWGGLTAKKLGYSFDPDRPLR